MTIYNPILTTDSYKFSHYLQYPKGATDVSSYIEARGSKLPGVTATVFAGLQGYIKEVLMKRVTMRDVVEAATFCEKHGVPFNREGWNIIVSEHGGLLPLTIDAAPEGSVIPLHNMMLQVHCNDSRLPWLTSYIETMLMSYIWYASTVATLSREIKKVIFEALVESSDKPEAEIGFKLHDFGYRGVEPGAAGVGGFAHLINFLGTDTVAGIEYAMNYYNTDVCGYSISASEHSTITSWGQDSEYEAYANMVQAYAEPGATFACVIDSYDTVNAIHLWTRPQKGNKSLLDQVKDARATVVLRPDSGDAVAVPVDVVEILLDEIGSYRNTKGFLVLPDHVRVIQGDGIDIDDVREILRRLIAKNISASNIGFGMGGGLLQKVNRDTFKFAMKANAIEIDCQWKDVYKNPVTDAGKKSKAGRQKLLKNKATGEYKTVPLSTPTESGWYNAMSNVYSSSKGYNYFSETSMAEIRKRAAP